MTAQFYVAKSEAAVNRLKQRLGSLGYSWSADEAVDLELLSCAYLDCEIITLRNLTDRNAQVYLADERGVKITLDDSTHDPLAGGLYYTSNGQRRWIFVESVDHHRRQRFTIAHEIGHLVLELEPHILSESHDQVQMLESEAMVQLRRYARCSHQSLDARDENTRLRPALTDALIRELDANHFAAELLMPYTGIKQILASVASFAGIRSDEELQEIVDLVSDRYNVSRDSAYRRLVRDLKIIPQTSSPNRDLFA